MDHIRLIASDMDATLLDENGRLPPKFEQTVRQLAALGIRFAAASGRPLYTLEDMFPTLRNEMIFIGDNGGAVRWRGEALYTSAMPPQDWQALARLACQSGDAAVLCGLETAYIERQFAQYDAVMKKFYTRVTYVDKLESVEATADKFTIYLPGCNAQEAYNTRYGPACGRRFSVTIGGEVWVDIMNLNVHKGMAINELGRKLSIPANAMMAFGDTYNDAEMLSAVRYGFLMENGSPALREKVPFLAPSNREYGVMKVLSRVIEQKGAVCPENFTTCTS